MGPCRSPEANTSEPSWKASVQLSAETHLQQTVEADMDASASWLVDTGASFHIVNEQTAELNNYENIEEPITLQTANGTQTIQQTASVKIPQLGARRCYTMPDSPNLLSLGELIQTEGCRFRWGPETGPELWDRTGRKLKVHVTNNVPVISTASTTEAKHVKEFLAVIGDFFEYVATKRDNKPKATPSTSISDIPVEHLLTHMPVRPGCEGCLRGKLTRAPARRNKERTGASKYLERLHIDIIGPVTADMAGNKYIVVIKDEHTKWAGTTPTTTREAAAMKRCLMEYHLGDPKFASNITCDGDASFQGEFAELCSEKQCRIHRTIPYRSTSNSLAERFNRCVNEGVRTTMATANAPYGFWGYAVKHWNVNYNHSTHNADATPFERKHGRSVVQKLVPFGCECYYVAIRPRKFADKGRRGIIIGYANSGAFKVLDWIKWDTTGLADITTTKDVNISATTFPWRGQRVDDRNGQGGQVRQREVEDITNRHGHSDHRQQNNEDSDREDEVTKGKDGDSMEPIPMFERIETGEEKQDSTESSNDADSDSGESQSGEQPMANDLEIEDDTDEEKEPTERDNENERDRDEQIQDDSKRKRTRSTGSFDILLHHLERIKKTKNAPAQYHEDEKRDKRTRDEQPGGKDIDDAAKRAKLTHDDICAALFGNVARPVRLNSEEGKSEEAIKAIQKEDDNHRNKGTWDYSEVEEWSEVRMKIAGAEIVRANLILVEKNSEDPNPALRKLKARLVARGDDVRDACGMKATEEELFGSPISLCASRMIDVYAGLVSGVTEVADVDGAYLQAPLKGAPKYIELPTQMWPKEWEGKFKRPVCKLHKALYGLQRAGFDWMDYASANLKAEKWVQLKDAEKHVYKRKCKNGHAVLGLYVDDCKLAARDADLEEAWESVQKCFKLGDRPERTNKYVGIWHETIKSGNITKTMTHQTNYTKQVVQKFKETCGKTHFRKVATPGRNYSEVEMEQMDGEGKYEETCRMHLGGLMYIARGSRPDISFVTSWLARYVTKWKRLHDVVLERLVAYIDCTSDHGIESRIDRRDMAPGKIWLEVHADSDFGGCHTSSRSTSGILVRIRGENGTRACIDWSSRRQGCVAKSTGEAEIVAVSDAMQRHAINAQILCESILGFEIPVELKTDSAAAIGAIQNGYGRVRYIGKTQRVSMAWLHDIFYGANNVITKVPGSENPADALTKVLERVKHEQHRLDMGLKSMRVFAEETETKRQGNDGRELKMSRQYAEEACG